MATVNYNCPNCAAPLRFNPDRQLFSCEYCLSDFSENEIQRIYAEREAKTGAEEKAEARQNEQKKQNPEQPADEAVVYTCPSCGAEVVTTASTAATTCFYCQNPVVLGGRLSGEFKPDRVVPFALSREKAVETFVGMMRKKKFLPNDFISEKQIEKMTGVYFPYWYIDSQQNSHMTAIGKRIKTWTTGKKTYTETSTYRIVRGGDVVIKNVFERALKSADRDMLQGVHPFDLTKAKDFSMSYLSGFQAEKRDIEKQDIQQTVDKRIDDYCKEALMATAEGYTGLTVESYNDRTDIESWNYTLLPVWVLTYKYKGKIFPYAINAQTGKTYGTLPVATGKLILLAAIITVAICLISLLGGLLLL